MSPLTNRLMKSGSAMSKKPKLYDSGSAGALPSIDPKSTTMALWPKRSKKISPGCIVAMPMRGAAGCTARDTSCAAQATLKTSASSDASSAATTARRRSR